MRVLVVSDTHGEMRNLEKVLREIGPFDMLLHLGDIQNDADYLEALADCPVEIVAGNNDYDWSLPEKRIILLGQHRIFMTHGHRYHVSLGIDGLFSAALAEGASVALFGHTHRPLLDTRGSVTLFNPGSLSFPRQADRLPSYGLLETDRFGKLQFAIRYLE